MKDDAVVTLKDIRSLNYCSGGSRKFFARHGLSWSDFLKNGISATTLEATGDDLAIKLAEVARGRR